MVLAGTSTDCVSDPPETWIPVHKFGFQILELPVIADLDLRKKKS
jgi:hypothetical protein